MSQPYPPRHSRRVGGVDEPTAEIPRYRPDPPAAPPAARKRWPWVVGGLVVVVAIGSAANSGNRPEPAAPPAVPRVATSVAATAAPEPTPAVAPAAQVPAVKTVTLPEVEGRNGGLVYDDLISLGLTDLTLASRDERNAFVLLPSNWTAVRIEPEAGTRVQSDQAVVVTMTKE